MRRRGCDVRSGDWTVALPAVTASLEPFPVSAGTATIASAARSHPSFAWLDPADRRLALALLSYSNSLRVYVIGQGECETIGQHRSAGSAPPAFPLCQCGRRHHRGHAVRRDAPAARLSGHR